MSYYQKYHKYKIKYALEKLKIEEYNSSINKLSLKMDNYKIIFFKTYNLISWNVNKLYNTPENNTAIKDYCEKNVSTIKKCEQFDETTINDTCCNFKGIGISRRSVHKFLPNSIIVKDDINFKFIKEFPIITTLSKSETKIVLYSYIKTLILQNIKNITKKQYDNILEVLNDNDYDITKIKNISEILEIVKSENFVESDEVIKIIFPNNEYKNDSEYKTLKNIYDADIPISSIQQNTNKLFQYEENYYFYFSYGTLKNIEFIHWSESLKIYVEEIQRLLTDENTKDIILCGHSVGSIVIQHLAIELIKNKVDISNIYVIGTGCRMTQVLNDFELEVFKEKFNNKYCFIISAYIDNDKIYYDHRDSDKSNKINKINTCLLLCQSDEFKNNYDNCKSVSFDILVHDDINSSDKFIPNPNIVLHDFSTYSKLYLNLYT
jgi:hypothetical protein